MNDQDWLRDLLHEIRQDTKDIKNDINEMKIVQVKQRSDIDSAHDKIRIIESDVSSIKHCVEKHKTNWIIDSLTDIRQSAIKAITVFLIIFLPLSCSNIKKSAAQTVNVMTQSQIIKQQDSTK